MKTFFSFVIKQSVAVILIVAFVLGFGIFSTVNMSINLLPDINVPMICVQVIYPGANAASVENDVTEKLERGLSSIGGITDVSGYSYDNLSALVFSFDYGTDTAAKKNDIQSELSSLDLPEGVTSSVYDIDLNAEALAVLSLTDKNGDANEAYKKAKDLASRLTAIDGVENVEIRGGADYSYAVKPFGGLELVTPLIVQSFSYGALDLPLGNITEADGLVQIRNNSDIKSESDISQTPITLPLTLNALFRGIAERLEPVKPFIGEPPYSDEILSVIAESAGFNISNELLTFIGSIEDLDREIVTTVGEIAAIERAASYTSYAYYCGGDAQIVSGIIIEIYKSNGANSSAVVEAVKSVYEEELSSPDYTAEIHLLDDQSEFISDSISNVLISMLIGGVLAIIIIFLFLKKFRTSLVIAITMPLSVLAALTCLFLMGITLNMVSLGGLAVGIGMLVDNSIVVIEAISKHRDKGKSAYAAAVDGTTEVSGALFGSTLTTVCVFIPIIFSGGLTAEIFTDLSFAVIFSLAFSLVVAVTVIPALYALFEGKNRLLKGGKVSKKPIEELPLVNLELANQTENLPINAETVGAEPIGAEAANCKKPKKTFKERVEKLKQPFIMDKLTSFYSKILPKVLNKKLVTVLTAVAVFGASIGLLFLTGTEFLPSIDKGQIEVTMSYGAGRQLEEIQSDVLNFSEVINDNIENIDYISVSVGKNGMLALTDSGIITVQLTTNRKTDDVVNDIRALAREYPSIGSVTVRQIDGVVASLMSGSDDLSVTIVGPDTEVLNEISKKIKARLEDNDFTDIKDSATDKSKQYTLSFDRGEIARLGLDYQTVVLTLRMGIASYTACTVTIDGEQYDVDVKFADGTVTGREELENFVVGFYESRPVRLKEILSGGKVAEEDTEACIRRFNGNRMISVSAALPDTDTGTASNRMQKIASEVLEEYEGYSFEESGISSYLSDAFKGLAIALVISFLLLYAVMAIQFGSALKPLIIMASIPFSFTGGFLALVITGTSLNVVSFIGLIMLMGVVVNNAIVMLEKIKQLHSEGMSHYDAVTKACCVRLRPILMTTLTTVLALIPLAIGVGRGSELMQPLGIVVIGGLIISTFVTLVLVPSVYCAVHRLSAKFPDGKKKNK